MNIEPSAAPIVRSHSAVDVFHQLTLATEKRAYEQVIHAFVAMLILINVTPPYIHVKPHIVERLNILVELNHGSCEARWAQVRLIANYDITA